MIRSFAILLLALAGTGALQAQDRWLDLTVAPETRCAPFNLADYPVPRSIVSQVIDNQGGTICSPYTNECFNTDQEMVVDHVIALAEAHDSGLCAADSATRSAFAADLRNLIVADPRLVHEQKGDGDATDWLPPQNRCWFAETIVRVRKAYGLTIDLREVDALIEVLTGCISDVTMSAGDGYVVASSGRVNARVCPATSCAVVTSFSSGQALDVTGHVAGTAWLGDARWLKVRHAGSEVFVHASLAETSSSSVTPHQTDTTATEVVSFAPSVNINQATTRYYVVAAVSANARACPGTNCAVISGFARGTAVDVLQRVSGESVNGDATWQAVKHDDDVIFVHAPLLSRSEPATVAPAPQPRPQQAAPAEQPARVSAPAIGGSFALGGQALSFAFPNHMHAARMTWVKRQVRYHRGDDAARVGGIIGQAHGAGFRVLLSIVGEPGQMAPDPAGYTRDFVNFLGGVASLGPNAIEVWNEQNISREWPNGQISPRAYTSMLSAAWNAIKAANPNVMVISGAPAPTGFFGGGCGGSGCDDLPFIRGMAAAGAASYMDCVGVHYNEGILSPDARSGDPRGNSGHYTRYYPRMFETYAATFPGKPLCFTELGYLSSEGFGPLPVGFAWAGNVTIADQANWLGRVVTLARSSGRVRLLIVWNVDAIRYDSDPQAGYAIVRPGGDCPACGSLAAAMG